MPNYVLRWIVDFLTDRTQCTKVGLNVSLSLDINSSIVQGSGIGASLFVVYISESDLKASGNDNCIIKFADDCSLLVPREVNNFDNKITSLSVSAQKYTY